MVICYAALRLRLRKQSLLELTLTALGQDSSRIANIGYDQILAHEHCSDSRAAIIPVCARISLEVLLIGVNKCLNCTERCLSSEEYHHRFRRDLHGLFSQGTYLKQSRQ